MRVRLDHVTNSSSSSFIIYKRHLDNDQIRAIRNHIELSQKLGKEDYGADRWNIEENELFISGYTLMDNFDMWDFLKDIDVDTEMVSWGEYPFKLSEIEVNDDHVSYEKEWRKLIHEM